LLRRFPIPWPWFFFGSIMFCQFHFWGSILQRMVWVKKRILYIYDLGYGIFPSVLDHYGSIYSIIISCNDLHEIPQAFLSGICCNDSRETRMKGFHQKGDLCRLPVFAIQRINRINNPKQSEPSGTPESLPHFQSALAQDQKGGPLYVYIIYIIIYIYMYHIYNVYYYILCIWLQIYTCDSEKCVSCEQESAGCPARTSVTLEFQAVALHHPDMAMSSPEEELLSVLRDFQWFSPGGVPEGVKKIPFL